MKTAKYIIQLTANNKEHGQVKEQIDRLFDQLRFAVDGDIDFYVQSIETKKEKQNRLYLLGKGKNLHFNR